MTNPRHPYALAAIAALTALPALALAGDACAPAFLQKVTTGGSVIQGNQNMGYTTAIAGNVAVVGEPGSVSEDLLNEGAINVFRFDGATWNFEQILFGSVPDFGTFFAEASLDTDGQIIAVGAKAADAEGTNGGAVYIFEYNGAAWVETARLTAPDPASSHQFGNSVALDLGRLYVGAPGYFHPGPPITFDTGAVFEYIKSSGVWTLNDIIYEDEPTSGAEFGHAVDVEATTMAVTAFDDTVTNPSAGSLIIFDGSSGDWQEAAKLAPADASDFDSFGWRTAVVDTLTIAVACPGCRTEAAGGAGAVYIYTGSGTWVQSQKLFAPDGVADDALATSLDADGNTIIAGTPLDDNGAPQTGSASIFRRTGSVWAFEATINAPDAQPGNLMGDAGVAVSGNTALVGVRNDDTAGFNAGAGYFFDLACPDDPPQGDGPDLDGSGTVDSIDLNLVLADFGCTDAPCSGDTDGDGDTDSTDLNNILAAFGTMP